MKINLVDTNLGQGLYANNHWPQQDIQYIKPPSNNWDGVTVFTDEQCFTDLTDSIRSKHKVAWALESPVIKPYVYKHISQLIDKFDKIYICNPELYNNHPKISKLEFGACWVPQPYCEIYTKNKLLSIVASNKAYAPGHMFRHEIIKERVHPELELWGSGYKWFSDEPSGRVAPFKDYMYVIVVENCKYPGYFTDKIIDCFATGCIPIYWGCPLMYTRFNKNGYYTFDTIEELKNILSKISTEDYYSKMDYIKENYKLFKKYASPDRSLVDALKTDGFL
mgnify:CR=1 FL=1